ncbi:MAG: tyrosine-type recombinase/integrase [Bacteroidales bacterium]|nr:tyrosine-type recombinase/integrase [Bacteroidales bacterium]
MLKNLNTFLRQDSMVFNYLPAQLKKYTHGWVIEYWCQDPATSEMKRMRIRVGRIRKRYATQREAVTHISKIVNHINIKLMQGWNPLIVGDSQQLYIPAAEVAKRFLNEKQKELRPDSIRSYRSFLNTFMSYFSDRCADLKYFSQFSKTNASRFMDYVYLDREVGRTAYNNYLKFVRGFFNWCVEHGYATVNPFANIKVKQKAEKKRTVIDNETRRVVTAYLEENEPVMLVVCKLMYYCLIRPKEIINLRVCDVDFSAGTIVVNSDVAKNHHCRHAAMTADVMRSLGYIKAYKPDMWLISQSWMPGYVKADKAKFSKAWEKLRNRLKLPKTMQLYSFRDSGIFDMLKAGIDPLTVKQHADHHSLSMTTLYSNHADPNLTRIIQEQAPNF